MLALCLLTYNTPHGTCHILPKRAIMQMHARDAVRRSSPFDSLNGADQSALSIRTSERDTEAIGFYKKWRG